MAAWSKAEDDSAPSASEIRSTPRSAAYTTAWPKSVPIATKLSATRSGTKRELGAKPGGPVLPSLASADLVPGFAGAVAVVHVVEGVVVAVVEVPAGDVVDVAVAVAVDAVGEEEDQVLRIGDAVAVQVGDRGSPS